MADLIVRVRDKNNTYTAKFGVHVASCTAGAEQAVRRLAGKILGDQVAVDVAFLGRIGYCVEDWAIRPTVTDRLALSAWPGGETVIVDDRGIAELYAGLNATAIKMRDGTEYLVHEAAEVIRYRIHERTGISVPIV